MEEPGVSRALLLQGEVMAVQTYSGTQNLSTNGQTLSVTTTKSEALGVAVADSMMLMTNLDSGKTGFVAYVLVDRGRPI